MAQDKPQYKRLPGKGWLGFYRTALWLGEDHILQEAKTWTSRLYHRFYFRDVHALIVRQSAVGGIYNGIFIALLAVLALVALAIGTLHWSILAVGGALVGLMVRNIYLGPTCVSHLQTAVHIRLLPSVKRVRTARALVSVLQPLVSEAQGGRDPEEVRRILLERVPTLTPMAPDQPPGPAPGPPGPA